MEKNTDKDIVRLDELVPQEILSWKANLPGDVYDPKTIFDYIDGAGEVYRSYNFKKLLAVRYTGPGRPDLVADIFDMGKSEDAFGVFTHDVEGNETGIGNDSTYKGGLLSFWKDRFFISVYTEEETEEAEKAVLTLGKRIAGAISKKGRRPEIISLLPDSQGKERSLHYFHTHLILNYHFFVSEENLLLLDRNTECVLSVRGKDESPYYLLLVRYPEEEKALRAVKRFLKDYLPDADQDKMSRTEDGLWTAVRRKGAFLLFVFNSPEKSRARRILESWEQVLSGPGPAGTPEN